jgi:hypothetical protein
MTEPLFTAAISLGSLCMGILLKYLFDLTLERQKAELKLSFDTRAETERAFRQARANCYADFLKSTADIAISQRSKDPRLEHEATARHLDAKARIVIYGSAAVMRALTDFIQHGAALTDDSAIARWTNLCEAMRADTSSEALGDSGGEIRTVLFGP